jgi:hypothetical protein
MSKLFDQIVNIHWGKNPRRARITKISDNRFNGDHPNNINEGYTREGYVLIPPEVGNFCIVGHLRTSPVTKIIDENTFETLNSTYRLEYLDKVDND